jgi:hypothetical protein
MRYKLWIFLEEVTKITKNLSQYIRSPGGDSNLGLQEYEASLVATRSRVLLNRVVKYSIRINQSPNITLLLYLGICVFVMCINAV